MAIQTVKNCFRSTNQFSFFEADLPSSVWQKVSSIVLSFFSTVAFEIYHFFCSLAQHSITKQIEQKNTFEDHFPLPNPFQHADLPGAEDSKFRVIVHPQGSNSMIVENGPPSNEPGNEIFPTNQIIFASSSYLK